MPHHAHRCGARPAGSRGRAEGHRRRGDLEALRRGEVETLVLLQGALEDRQAYAGPQPLLLATDPDELRALGVDDPAPDRLDELLLRAALGQDAGLLPLHAPVGVLPDGVGAVLRFSTRPDETDEPDREAV